MRQPFPPELCLFYPRAGLTGSAGESLGEVIVDDAPDGALCSVPGQGLYLLNKTSVAAVSSPTVIATGRGASSPGRWVQLTGPNGASVNPPLRNTLYVDPTSTVTPTGTILAPYTSIQAAINETVAGEQWTIKIPPGIPCIGNLTIPAVAGTSIEICADGLDQGGIIQGTITWSANDAFFGLTNIHVSSGGSIITGAAIAESTFIAQNCILDGFIGWDDDEQGIPVHCYLSGPFPIGMSSGFAFARSGSGGNAIDTPGNLFIRGVRVEGDVQCLNGFFENSYFSGEQLRFSSTQARMTDCQFGLITAITFEGDPGTVRRDGVSAYGLANAGPPALNNGAYVDMDF